MTDAVAVITGGSRGIGAATARLAAAAGYAVGVGYREDAASAGAIVSEITDAGGRAVSVAADVSREGDVVRLFDTVEAELGAVTALVNNAGIVAAKSPLATMTLERIERIVAVNVVGALLCAREAARRMSTARGGGGGVIVNVSSGAALGGSPSEYVDYAASKGAIDTFTVGLAKELAREGIRVAAVRPGFIETDIHASGGDPGRAQRLGAAVPMGRSGRPEEVAAAILWLLSDAASYATGAIIDVAGGK